tara:strand:+ start:430 stop:1431 length:1002 start_codon:yes stop_codon:yes gene_type:complete
MIICRSPLRISLFGGGTDLPEWHKKNNGLVIGGSINKYSYIHARFLPDIFKFNYRLRYYKTETVKNINQIKHKPYSEILKHYGFLKDKIEIIHTADLPALSGLGSSSSSTVSAINAICALKGAFINKKNLANLAIKIEKKILKENVGYQDQIFSAFGGFNCIRFNADTSYSVENLMNNKRKLESLNNSSILLWTDIQRHGSEIEGEKIKNIKNNKKNDILKHIQEISENAYVQFTKPNWNLKHIGNLMNEYWYMKKQLSKKITNTKIDQICKLAMNNGAYGTKLLGAGGGGFVFILCPSNKKKFLINKLSKFAYVDFKFENSGSSIIYNKYLI